MLKKLKMIEVGFGNVVYIYIYILSYFKSSKIIFHEILKYLVKNDVIRGFM